MTKKPIHSTAKRPRNPIKPSTPGAKSSPLSPKDQARLKTFRISKELIERADLRRVTNTQARGLGFTFAFSADLSGRVYPYKDATGQLFNARLRRDNPERNEEGKEENKYLSLPKKRRGLYWPPGAAEMLRRTPACDVVLVEAENSALAIIAAAERAGRRLVALAMGGCYGWRGKTGESEDTAPLRDLEALRGHPVYLMLDSNVVNNENVKRAELQLAAHLAGNLQVQVSALRVPAEREVNGPDDFLAKHKDRDFWRLFDAPAEPWLAEIGESYEKYLSAKPPDYVIQQFLQTDGATFVGGLSGHGKTFVLLSMVQSLLTGKPLFGHFRVVKQASRVIYLTPEITLGGFKRRAELFGLGPHIKSGHLIVRTLSAYPMLQLTDPALLLGARGADIFLDTAVRFSDGDENSSSDNDRGLAAGIFGLFRSGARTVTGSHHSPKGFEGQNYMSLENILRGSGDIGAMVSTAWGVRLIDRQETRVHVENIKARDFEPPPPFQIQGRPQINEGRGFQMILKPGECGALANYLPKKTGRPPSTEKAERTALLVQMVKEKKTTQEITEALEEKGVTIKKSTVEREIRDARQLAKLTHK